MKNTAFCEKAELVGEVRPCAYDLGTINFNKKKNIRQNTGFCTFWFIVTMKSTTQTDIHIKVNQ
jgi:hypothetical protein